MRGTEMFDGGSDVGAALGVKERSSALLSSGIVLSVKLILEENRIGLSSHLLHVAGAYFEQKSLCCIEKRSIQRTDQVVVVWYEEAIWLARPKKEMPQDMAERASFYGRWDERFPNVRAWKIGIMNFLQTWGEEHADLVLEYVQRLARESTRSGDVVRMPRLSPWLVGAK